MDKNTQTKIKSHTEDFLDKMGVNCEIIIEDAQDFSYINIKSPDSALLIGRGGETLNALEHILRIMVQKKLSASGDFPRITFDISNYRKNQVEKLRASVKDLAQKVISQKSPETLWPMNAYERRITHLVIKDFKDITSESVGEDPNRRIIIKIAS